MAEEITKHGLVRIYRLLCFFAWCDGELADAEREVLEKYRKKFELPDAQAALLEDEGRRGVSLDIGQREAELKFLADAMIDVTLADGVLAVDEQKRLRRLGKEIGLSEPMMVARIKKRLHQTGQVLRIQTEEELEEEEEDEEDDDDV